MKKRAAPPPSTPTVTEPKRKKHAKTKRGQWDEIEDIFRSTTVFQGTGDDSLGETVMYAYHYFRV